MAIKKSFAWVLVFSVIAGVPSVRAQERETREPAAPRSRQPEREREQERERQPNAGEQADAGQMNARAAQKKILLEEAKYRDQLARINRLRELAQEQGNQQRLAALDKLEAKMTQLHERKVNQARASLSGDQAWRVDDEIKKGRGHAKGKTKARSEAPQRESKQPADKNKNRDAERDKTKPRDDKAPPADRGRGQSNGKPGA